MVHERCPTPLREVTTDHLIREGGRLYAGHHLIVDCFGCERLDELAWMEETLRRCVDVAGATLLHIHLHHFGEGQGVSGVAVLAESHISVHTWPERGYAAFDAFMCGQAQPEKIIPVLKEAFAVREVCSRPLVRGEFVDG